MENKPTDNMLHYFSSGQSAFSRPIQKIKNLFMFLLVTVIIIVVIYSRELLMTNLNLGKDVLYMTPEEKISDSLLSNKIKVLHLARKRDIFVKLKNIRQSIKNIFFIESRCGTEAMRKHFNKRTTLTLKPRQACAAESTALMNPECDVYILYTCPLADDFLQRLPDFTKQWIYYPNVFIVEVNSTEAFMNTPVQELYESKKLENSTYPVQHFSDLLRFIVLWKFGGTYLDLDVITIKPMKELGTNYAGIESPTAINPAVLNVDPFGIGHELMQKALEFVNEHFNGEGWGKNGPEVLTKVILKECNRKEIDEELYKCDRFHLLPPKYFYHIHWTREHELFDVDLGPKIVETVKNISYVVHMWNQHSSKHTIDVGSNQAYGLLANEFCPNVINYCRKEF